MDWYSSLKFIKLYLGNDIPGTYRLYHIQFIQDYMDMNTAIKNCACLVNNNGVFTVVGWYKRVIINDRSLIVARNGNNTGNHHNNTEEDVLVDAGDICYHFVQIILTNRESLDPRIPIYQNFCELKYGVTKIRNA